MSPRRGPPGAPADGGALHLVILTPYYWPILCAATHLMKALAEGLAAAGHQVTVLTNGPRGAGTDDPPLLAGRIHRVWNPFLQRLGVPAKFGEYAWFTAFFLLRGLALRKVDLIFVPSTPPLAGLPAALLARIKGARLVYDLQDIFPDSAVVAGMLSERGLAYRLLRRAEEATYRAADLVISISEAFSEYVAGRAPGTPVTTIPNWVDTDALQPRTAEADPAIAEYRQGLAFVAQYAGNLGYMQDLEVVVRAAERLRDVAGLGFVFIGDGNAKQAMQARVRELGLANCRFLPLQPLDRVPSVYNACDVGLVPLKAGAARIAVPSKTWNYLAAGRPVIGCVEAGSPLADVLRESGAGSVSPPGDPARLAEAILAYRDDPGRAGREGRQGRAFAEARLSLRAAVARHRQEFEMLAARTRPVRDCIAEDPP